MADRRFDTYMPSGSEALEIFLESIRSKRYLFFAIKVGAVIIIMYYMKFITHVTFQRMKGLFH